MVALVRYRENRKQPRHVNLASRLVRRRCNHKSQEVALCRTPSSPQGDHARPLPLAKLDTRRKCALSDCRNLFGFGWRHPLQVVGARLLQLLRLLLLLLQLLQLLRPLVARERQLVHAVVLRAQLLA